MTTKSNKPIRRVLVLGGGIAGATVAERLGRGGLDVQWVEKAPVIGGKAAAMGCKAADICLRRHVCVATDRLKAARRACGSTPIPNWWRSPREIMVPSIVPRCERSRILFAASGASAVASVWLFARSIALPSNTRCCMAACRSWTYRGAAARAAKHAIGVPRLARSRRLIRKSRRKTGNWTWMPWWWPRAMSPSIPGKWELSVMA